MSTDAELEHDPSAELVPALSRRWVLGWRHLAIITWFSLFFLYYNYIPLFHSDIWGHVSYGHWMLDHGSLPEQDPFVRLAEGVPAINTAWLGQVVLAWSESVGGAEAISHLFALCALASALLLTAGFTVKGGRPGLAVVGVILAWLIGWSRHAIVRPEMFGGVCFAGLLWLVASIDRQTDTEDSGSAPQSIRWWQWALIPVIFVLWANLHGSFAVGLILLGCCVVGRAIDVLWRSKSLLAVFQDRGVRRWLLLTELATAATLVNPYGIDLLIQTATFSQNPNLNDVLEWFRLEMVSFEGIGMGFSWLLLVVLFRHSRARIRATDVVLLMVFTLATCLRVRMIAWYAPVVMLALMPHLADVWGRLASHWSSQHLEAKDAVEEPLTTASFRYTLLSVLVVWLCFSFSPISSPLLGGRPRDVDHVYSRGTPRAVTRYLRENPPQGQIANPQWWGDWLVWDGPDDLEVFMTTNAVHLAPNRVWKDYLAIARGNAGLEQRLDRYRINTIVVDRELQVPLDRLVRRLAGWKIAYQDNRSLIVQRVGTVGTKSNKPRESVASTGTRRSENVTE